MKGSPVAVQMCEDIRKNIRDKWEKLANQLQESLISVLPLLTGGKNTPNMLTKKVLYDFCKKKGLKQELIKNINAY